MTDTAIRPADAATQDIDNLVDFARLDASVGAWAEQYASARPFPHIAVPDFLKPGVIERLIAEFPLPESKDWTVTHDKTGHFEQKFNLTKYERFPPHIRQVFDLMNSRPMIEFFEKLTGIDGLIPDPHFYGGGLHMLARGGRLGMHVDFNRHNKMKLDRRLNALIYVNPVWEESWNGSLELWNEDVTTKVAAYPPIANQMLVFSTTEKSYHGHPDPLDCPPDVRRRSLALYYYTNGRPEDEVAADHTTRFKLRPGEKQRPSLKYLMKQATPPVIWDWLQKIARR